MKAEDRILRLMRDTGQPLVVSGVSVIKWRARSPPWDETRQRYTRLQVGVSPLLSEDPSAYIAVIDGARVSIRAVNSLLKKRHIEAMRPWRIRGRFRLAPPRSATR
jgi:hypothetical protein